MLALASCSSFEDAAPAPTVTSTSSTVPTETTAPPTYTGDPDSDFCELIRQAADRPVLDPFQPGLEPTEVQLRFRALRNRFREFAEVAPAELADDLDRTVDALADLEQVLADGGWDFDRLAEGDVDLSMFDAPVFADVSARLSAYRDQVCSR